MLPTTIGRGVEEYWSSCGGLLVHPPDHYWSDAGAIVLRSSSCLVRVPKEGKRSLCVGCVKVRNAHSFASDGLSRLVLFSLSLLRAHALCAMLFQYLHTKTRQVWKADKSWTGRT